MRRISNSLRNLSGAQLRDRLSICSESLAPTPEPAGGPMFYSSGEGVLTWQCCIFAPRYFANRFAIGSSAILSRCCERTTGEGLFWISSQFFMHYMIGSSRVLGGGSPTGH